MKAMKLIRATLAAAVAAATALPLGSEAASSSNIGPALITTPVNLNFSVAVPRFVRLGCHSAMIADRLSAHPFAGTSSHMGGTDRGAQRAAQARA